jgi:hypothetical protein
MHALQNTDGLAVKPAEHFRRGRVRCPRTGITLQAPGSFTHSVLLQHEIHSQTRAASSGCSRRLPPAVAASSFLELYSSDGSIGGAGAAGGVDPLLAALTQQLAQVQAWTFVSARALWTLAVVLAIWKLWGGQ